jgi:aspartate/methionine/tyrosine aminotransferase
LQFPQSYYAELKQSYEKKRDLMVDILEEAGFRCFLPMGAYYVMCDASAFGFPNDIALAKHLVENIGVAAVPGSSFFTTPGAGDKLIRFCFAKKDETLLAAAERLRALR